MANLILNPLSNRFIKIGGPKYNRLIKEKVITPTTPEPSITPEPPTIVESSEPPEQTPEPAVSLKTEFAKVAVDLVKKNKSQFRL